MHWGRRPPLAPGPQWREPTLNTLPGALVLRLRFSDEAVSQLTIFQSTEGQKKKKKKKVLIEGVLKSNQEIEV